MNKKTKAFFDFDGTLSTKDSLLPFIIYTVGWPIFLLKSILMLPSLLQFILNKSQRGQVKNQALLIFLAPYSKAFLTEKATTFVDNILPNMMRPEGILAYQEHIKLGHECILVSASLDLYLNIWAQKNGFTQVICTPFLGTPPHMMGTNCYGTEKVNRIMAIHPDLEQYDTVAYGDTVGDIPMLQKMNRGFMWSPVKQAFQIITLNQ